MRLHCNRIRRVEGASESARGSFDSVDRPVVALGADVGDPGRNEMQQCIAVGSPVWVCPELPQGCARRPSYSLVPLLQIPVLMG